MTVPVSSYEEGKERVRSGGRRMGFLSRTYLLRRT